MDSKITCVVAHPDDEIIFGFPVIKQAKKIISCVSDVNNPKRTFNKERKRGLEEICKLIGAEFVCFDYSSKFYRLDHREMEPFVDTILNAIKHEDTIFTHNDWGEYGHLDHQLVNTIVKLSGKRMLVTDINLYADWYKVHPYSQGTKIGEFENDLDFYNNCAEIYRKYTSWTWTFPPILKTNLYESNHLLSP